MKTRCSSLDRVMACSGSLLDAAHPYNPESDEAREGTAAHAALAVMVSGAEPDLEVIATEHRVDRDALDMLMRRGREAWEQVRQWFPGAVPEASMQAELSPGGAVLTGTADVLSTESMSVLDWKAGWQPSDHPHQLRGYAYLATRGAEGAGYDVEEVLAIEVHLRTGQLEVHRWSRSEMEAWAQRLLHQVERAGQQWGPGPVSCQYCPHQTTCAAREEYIRGAVTALAPIGGNGGSITPAAVASLWDQSRLLKRALERYETIVGEMLSATGPIQLDEHRELRHVAVDRTKIIPSRAMRVLRESLALTPAEANACLRISKGALCDVVKARAEKGRGAGAVRELLAALEQAEAIKRVTTYQKRAVNRAKEKS